MSKSTNTSIPRIPARQYAEPFRSRRMQSQAFAEGLEVVLQQKSGIGDPLHGTGKDLSARGVKVSFSSKHQDSHTWLRQGTSLDNVEIYYFDTPIFSGKGTVRHHEVQGSESIVGIELIGPNVSFDVVYADTIRLDFRYRIQGLATRAQDVLRMQPHDFRQWLEGCKDTLRSLREFLNAEEVQWKDADVVSRAHALEILIDEACSLFLPVMHAFRDVLNQRVANFSEEEHAHHQAMFREVLGELLFESHFIHRAFHKPLGYAGDYELMSMLYRPKPEGPSLFSQLLTQHAKDEAAGRATINRLEYVSRIIRSVVDSSSRDRVCIASIGCGAARELVYLLSQTPEIGERLDIALLDQDTRALEVCEKVLLPFSRRTGAQFSFIGDPIQSLIRENQLGACLGGKDLIYSVGLYDYLDDKIFVDLSKVLYSALNPGGKLVIGNMAAHNPTLYWMAYAMDWFLIHRSEQDLLQLASKVVSQTNKTVVDAEPTGINLFLHLSS
ncbi:MAG: hypothetical protein ACPGUV_00230 [Polyangiales bacterium]